MLEITTGVRSRLGFFFQQRQVELDNHVTFLDALTFFGDAFEAFAFQFYGIDAEVDEQLNAAVDSIENAWLVSKILPMVPSTGQPFCCRPV